MRFSMVGSCIIFFNMSALSQLGVLLESWQGRWRYAAILLVSTFTGGVLGVWMKPQAVTLGF